MKRSALPYFRSDKLVYMFSLTLLFVFFLSLVACGQKKLSQKNALGQLQSAYQDRLEKFDREYTVNDNGKLVYPCAWDDLCDKSLLQIQQGINREDDIGFLLKKDLVTSHRIEKIKTNSMWTNLVFDITLTEKGKKLLHIEQIGNVIKLSGVAEELDNIKIMNIGEPSDFEGKRVSVVKYQASFKPTPLGQAIDHAPRLLNGEAYFVLYDNGWKLENI